MKIVLDACVLYPTVMREILLGVAAQGLFQPIWSARILEEWARAVVKLGPDQEVFARGEIVTLRANWPTAEVPAAPELEASLYLPDVADRHVLASAISGKADAIVTMNLRDFPKSALDEFQLAAVHPDAFLRDLHATNPDAVGAVVSRVHQQAEHLSGTTFTLRGLMKKARLPRLGKALT